MFPWCVGGRDVRNHLMWCGEAVVRCVETSGEM